MKKIYLNTVLALTVAFTSLFAAGITVKAETQSLDWDVHYDGKSFSSTYSKDKAVIENTMPGDTIVYSIDYYNDSTSDAEIFMSADVVKTLEEGSKASGGAYSYKIETENSSQPLFVSQTVGGDATDDANALMGLLQVNGAERNGNTYFSLGTTSANSKGKVTITVVLDGNSQNNSYMSTLGTLEIKFGAEPINNDTVVNHNKVVQKVVQTLSGGTQIVEINDDKMPTTGNPRTGDSIIPLVICTIALLFGLLLILWYFKTTNKKREVA